MVDTIVMDREQIKGIIPHREPFLLLDRIVEYEEGKRAVGEWTLTGEEYFFKGHFPDYPVLPGVLMVESLAQVGAVVILDKPENRGKIALFAGIDNVRFKSQVRPGDTLRLEVELTKIKGPIGKGAARATVDGRVAVKGELMFAVK